MFPDSIARGREARPAPAAWNIAKTLAQTAVFWGIFLAALPAGVYWLEGRLGLYVWRFPGAAARALGVLGFVLGGGLGLSTGMLMAWKGRGTPLPLDCPRELVIEGPYCLVRNPMAIAGIAQGAAVGLFLGSPAVVLYALSGAALWNALVRPWEERDLEDRFGESYRRYRDAVHCWLPRSRPYRASMVERQSDRDATDAESKQP